MVAIVYIDLRRYDGDVMQADPGESLGAGHHGCRGPRPAAGEAAASAARGAGPRSGRCLRQGTPRRDAGSPHHDGECLLGRRGDSLDDNASSLESRLPTPHTLGRPHSAGRSAPVNRTPVTKVARPPECAAALARTRWRVSRCTHEAGQLYERPAEAPRFLSCGIWKLSHLNGALRPVRSEGVSGLSGVSNSGRHTR